MNDEESYKKRLRSKISLKIWELMHMENEAAVRPIEEEVVKDKTVDEALEELNLIF